MMRKLLTSMGAVVMAFPVAASAGDFGSSAELDPSSATAAGYVDSVRGYSYGRVDFDSTLQYSRGSAIDVADGVRTSHSYAIRVPGGHVIAGSFNLSVAPGDRFFGSSHAEGGYSAAAGGDLDRGSSGATWGYSLPSFAYPADSQAYTQSLP